MSINIVNSGKLFDPIKTSKSSKIVKSMSVNFNKTINSKPANITHHKDSIIVNTITLKHKVLSVHDMFILNAKNKHKVMDEVNLFYNGEHGEYGMFSLK